MLELEGKVAIVTGAARMRGIGRACALALAGAGADVVITGTARPPEAFPEEEKRVGWCGLASVADEIEAKGRRVLALTSDASNAKDVQDMVQKTLDRFGRIDVLVNNAAASRGGDRVAVVDMPDEVYEKVVMTNLMSNFLSSKYVARQMIKQGQGGKIVSISSLSGKRGLPNRSAYCSSKFGILGFTQTLALELARHKINVNAICPGTIDTERISDRGTNEAQDWGVSLEEARERITAREIPWGREGTGEDIANLAVFLCSKHADYMTGQSINVCGGKVLH